MRPAYTITIASVNKKPDEETATRLRRTRPAEKIIFWDRYGTLLSKYLPGGTTISGSYYASITERLCSAILEKCRGKVSDGVLLLHDNVSIYKYNIVQAAIRKAAFIELNDLAYSPDIALSDSQTWKNLFVGRILVPMMKQSILLTTI